VPPVPGFSRKCYSPPLIRIETFKMSLDWAVQSVRLTLFSLEPPFVTDKDWQAITGQDNEAETRQALPGGGKRFSGNVANGVLSVGAVGSRTDIVLSAPDPSQDITLPVVGTLDDTFPSFFESTAKWLEATQLPINRIAFGSMLLCHTANRAEAYRHLGDLLTSVKVDPGMHDLLFRVNWRRASKVIEGLKLNRLTTWNSLEARVVFVDGAAEVVAASDQVSTAIRLEIDHSTDGEHKTAFDRGRLKHIYWELVELARENAVKGELP